MKLRPWCRVTFILAAALCASSQPLQPLQRRGTVQAFTLYEQELQYAQSDSGLAPQPLSRIVARSSTGAHMTSFTAQSPRGEAGWVVEIYDMPNRRYVSLEPFTKSMSTSYFSAEEASNEHGALTTCTPSQIALFSTTAAKVLPALLGYAVAVEVEQDSRGGKTLSLIARDLDCYPLKRTETSPRGSHNEFTVTKVEEGEPVASLFKVPEDYVERSPNQIYSLYTSEYPGSVIYGSSLARINSYYFAHQAR